MKQRGVPVWLVAVAALVAVGWYLVGGTIGSATGTDGAGIPVSVDDGSGAGPSLPTVDVGDLPVEARETLLLIDQGGPFPYSRDDTVFQNRERLLPIQDQGYYREYTVTTPGSDDRGARRIVAGVEGDRYYTDDHYSSFRMIVGSGS